MLTKKIRYSSSLLATKFLINAKKDADRLIIEMNDKFHKSSEIKKNLAENKISSDERSCFKRN